MKKLLLSLTAMIALGATSCVTDATNDLTVGNESVVTFSVESQNASRAIADGENANTLSYAVYDAAGNHLSALGGEVEEFNGRTTINLTLLNQNNYTIVFWADAENGIYNFNAAEKIVTANYTGVTANDDTLDAFYAVVPVEVNGSTVVTATLTRPFAQVNFGANDVDAAKKAGFNTDALQSTFTATVPTRLNLLDGTVGEELAEVEFESANIPGGKLKTDSDYTWVAMNYVFAAANDGSLNTCELTITDGSKSVSISYPNAPVKRNWKTNLIGALLTGSTKVEVEVTPDFEEDGTFEKEISVTYNGVNYESVAEAISVAVEDENNDSPIITVSGDVETPANQVTTIPAGKNLTLEMKEGAKMTFTGGVDTRAASNQIVFDVRGEMTINGGTIEYEYRGENMGWNAMTTIFNVTAGGVLNLNGVTATNKGGTDMGFVAHLNNWGEVTLNAENCTLESNYVAVRVFNSGPNKNNVDIKNSTLKGGSYAFWVHNYTVEDFGTEAKAEAQKALLNLNIYNQGNTFSPDVNGIRYGFTNPVKSDAYGITKVVSEDGTIVTLGSVVENGLVRRGVAGAEENTTIKKVIVEEGVGVLYDRTFRRYYALEEVVLPSTLTTIGAAGSGVFQSCSNLKSIVLPESVTVLGEGTFQECTSLASINIPAGVTRIEKNVFRNTGLTSVEFHAGVTYFGNYAFRDCEELTEITINAPSFTVESDTFLNAAGPFPAYVIKVANAEMKAYLESRLSAHQKTFITVVAPKTVTTADELVAAFESNKTVILGANLEDGSIKLPATLNNFTLRAAEGVSLKNFTISAADGNAYYYENLTFDGLTFDNSRILLTGWRNGEEVLKNLTITNCVFKNLDDTTNTAPVHINKDAAEAVENFTFTNNVINGATGGSKSGVYAQVTGKVVFENNVINNVSFRPYVIQVTTDDGIDDSFSVKGNTFSGSSVGRAQGLGNNDAGTDIVELVVSGNIFKDITEAQQICYWNFNAATTTADLSKNYYSIDIEANPSRIYYNRAASSVEDLKEMGVYPFYTELNADGTINLNSLKQAE